MEGNSDLDPGLYCTLTLRPNATHEDYLRLRSTFRVVAADQ